MLETLQLLTNLPWRTPKLRDDMSVATRLFSWVTSSKISNRSFQTIPTQLQIWLAMLATHWWRWPVTSKTKELVQFWINWFSDLHVGQYLRTNIGKIPRFDNGKISTELGLKFTDIDNTFADTVNELISFSYWVHLLWFLDNCYIAKGQIPDLRDRSSPEGKVKHICHSSHWQSAGKSAEVGKRNARSQFRS